MIHGPERGQPFSTRTPALTFVVGPSGLKGFAPPCAILWCERFRVVS